MPSKVVRRSVRKTGRKASRPKRVDSTKASGKQDSARSLQEQLTRRTAELAEARAQQTATAEILNVIANSPANVQPVLDAVVKAATRFCGAEDASINLLAGDDMVLSAHDGPIITNIGRKLPLDHTTIAGQSLPNARTVHVPDIEATDAAELTITRQLAREHGFRAIVAVPMIREGRAIGILFLRKALPGAFAERQIALLETLAAQAVIAIENTRLFNETREALERQTATADILKVIASSPSDVQPVFEAIATSAKRLLGGFSCTVFRFIDGMAHLKAFTPTTPKADEILRASFPRPIADVTPFRAAQSGDVMQIPDTEDAQYELGNVARARGYRSMLFAPLVSKGESTGFIAVTRVQPGAFAPQHVQLLQAFADQAVIAIENTRLFNEVQAKTADLEESLQQQTATSEVLQVISSSPGDLAPVFDKMLENATKVCGAEFGSMTLVKGDALRRAALYNAPPAYSALRTDAVLRLHPRSAIATAIRTRQVVQVEDIRNSPAYLERAQASVELAELGGARTIVVVPMQREDEVIGVITVYRQEVRLFGDKQIELLSNFARQAVIAIENARLLRELRQRTNDLSEALTYQTGSADILKVIAASPTDVTPVLKVIVESACEICEAYDSTVLLRDGDDLRVSAHHGPIPVKDAKHPIHRNWAAGRAVVDRKTVHVGDMLAEGDEFPLGAQIAAQTGNRSVVCAPLFREGESIGVIVLRRAEVHPFSDKQIALLQTFADQAVIAIGNVSLFEEVQQRTRELSKSLDDLRAAQDRLIQTEKLASLGQLTAGIAHEIKNPLNFVNNFASLSAELTAELNDALKPAILDETIRAEVNEITGLLKDNLGKVVQHGKRADSIVKNMLLHSREGSGERRTADVNALVGESLNLAYHGARAEKPHFAITLRHDLDPDVGTLGLYPQEITRALLNLISNGFYAATRRKAETDDGEFEPALKASTRNLGTSVEIRIRDNGGGIPPEVREKMFNPFFTTKPTGEGTGLGLSMTHDIIVKQHGGRIDVETEPGKFTEFIITLPRGNGTARSKPE